MSERSEGKKHRKYSHFKEGNKRTVILAKKEEKDNENKSTIDKHYTDTGTNSQPKIILKSKEKDQHHIATNKDFPEISIAQNSKNINNKETKDLPTPIVIEQSTIQIQSMVKPVDLITHNLAVNSQSFEFLIDTNSLFFVVGVIGMKGVGKSTILNLLSSNNNENIEEILFLKKDGIFQKHNSSSGGEGIQMYITKDRTILLDCSPLLHNPYKKDCTMNEMDDLKLTIFMLSVCHLVIVVQEDYLNTNLIRLLQNAEMMKPLYSKDSLDEYFPNLMFVKNYGTRHDFLPKPREMTDCMYKQFFKNSKLNIFSGGNNGNKANLKINHFYFPYVDLSSDRKSIYQGHPNLILLVTDLRQRVLMSPKRPMLNITPFTEKNWSQLITTVWESHKSNFFLHILLENGNVKDKMFMVES